MDHLGTQYERIEGETAAFSRATGVACPAGCGECCTAIDFRVSRPEAERVAEFLLDHPQVLERFLAHPNVDGAGKLACPLYDPDAAAAHCTVYEARPLLCRTFAFAAHREKDGTPAYAPCRRFKEDAGLAARVEAAKAAFRGGTALKLPIFPDESLAVQLLDPSGESLPMGPAVARAVELLRYRREAAGRSQGSSRIPP